MGLKVEFKEVYLFLDLVIQVGCYRKWCKDVLYVEYFRIQGVLTLYLNDLGWDGWKYLYTEISYCKFFFGMYKFGSW